MIIIAAARLGGRLSGKAGEPVVVGQMFTAILLGPTLLDCLSVQLSRHVFLSQAPPAMASSRNWQSSSTRSRSELVSIDRTSVAPREWLRSVSLCSVVLPFFLRPRFLLGAAMSVTAFVVLARILDEPVLQGTIVGALALACAAPTFAVAATRPSSRPC